MNQKPKTFLAVSLACATGLTAAELPYRSWADTTIAGRDADRNGVRDDIDALIRDTLRLDPAGKAALSKQARIFTRQLELSQDSMEVIRTEREFFLRTKCFHEAATRGGTNDSLQRYALTRVFAKQCNNKLRTLAYIRTRKVLAGTIHALPDDCIEE